MVTDRITPLRIQRPRRCIWSGCPTTGAGPGWSPATRPTSCCRWCSTPTFTSASTRRPPATSCPAGARGARLAANSWPTTGGGRGSSHEAAPSSSGRPPTGRGEAPQGLLHRHLDLHRLQGLRGGLQGVEPRSRDVQGFSGKSYDNTGRSRRRPLAARGLHRAAGAADARDGASLVEAAQRARTPIDGGVATYQEGDGVRWLMSSDVCKHCTDAACLEVCPTGALFRTEFGTVVVQEDICNGCGYCVPGLPVRGHRPARGRRTGLEVHPLLRPAQGRSWSRPARRPVPPTRSSSATWTSSASAPSPRVEQAARRRAGQGQLYLADSDDGVGGAGAFFLLLDEPEVYGLPPDPVDTTRDLGAIWQATAPAPPRWRSGVPRLGRGAAGGERERR